MPVLKVFGDQAWCDALSVLPSVPNFLGKLDPTYGEDGPDPALEAITTRAGSRGFQNFTNPQPYTRFWPVRPEDELGPVATGSWFKGLASTGRNFPGSAAIRVVRPAEADPTFFIFTGRTVSSGVSDGVAIRRQTVVTNSSPTYVTSAEESASFRVDEWRFYELVAEIDGSDLLVQGWLDGSLLLSATIDLGNSDYAITHAGRVAYIDAGDGELGWELHGGYIADFRVGPSFVQIARPTAQGFHDEWQPPAGWADINNEPGTSDFVAGQDGDLTSYPLDAFDPSLGANVVTLQTTVVGSRSDDATAASLVRSDDPDDEVAPEAMPLSSSVQLTVQPMDVNPHTSAPWQWSDVNNYEFGLAALAPGGE